MDCLSRYPLLKSLGTMSLWISLHACRTRKGLELSWLWWIASQSTQRSLPRRPVAKLKLQPVSSCATSSSIGASPNTSLVIETLDSTTHFGESYSVSWGRNCTFRPVSIYKQMGRPTVSMRSWSVTCDTMLVPTKRIGPGCWTLPSSHIICSGVKPPE